MLYIHVYCVSLISPCECSLVFITQQTPELLFLYFLMIDANYSTCVVGDIVGLLLCFAVS